MEQAVRARTAAKGWLTRATTEIENILRSKAAGESVSESQLVDALEQFSKRLNVFDEAQGAVELLIDINELDDDIQKAAEFRDSKRKLYLQGSELCKEFQKSSSAEGVNNSSSASSVGPSGMRDLPHARLPKLELPKFSGDHTGWQPFWDKFKAVIDNSDLATVTKFTYLQSLLKGEASAAISGLALTEANYVTACDILQQRFGRRERIVFGHIQELLNLTSTGRTVEALWTLYDKLQTHIRSLESLDITGATYGVILTPLVLHRLPESVRLEWARTGEGRESDLKALLQFLLQEIQRRERSRTFQQKEPPKAENRPTAAALHSNSSDEKSFNHCRVCSGRHRTDRCFRFRDLDKFQRKEKCKEKGLCFICLEPHLARDCRSELKCPECNGHHHRLLCINNKRPTKTGSPNRDQNQPQNKPESPVNLHANLAKNSGRQTMLQIAQVRVKGNGPEVKANLLFDSGSDKSYISSSFVRKIDPRFVGQELVSVALFGDPKPKDPKMKRKYEIQLCCEGDFNETLVVMESPVICSPVFRPTVPEDILRKIEIRGIALAEGSLVNDDSQVEIDILVGLDYYWKLVKPKISVLSPHLSAQETKFGWILSGSWEERGQKKQVSHQFLCMGDVKDSLCHKIWDLETIGITPCDDKGSENKVNDLKTLENFNETVQFTEGRYVVHLPWKDGQHDKLTNNEASARKRCENLSRKFDKDPVLEAEYSKVLSDMENNGIIHEVPREERDSSNPTFYLPHRPVIREASVTTKIRPVFDASTKGVNGYSLNDCVEAGPNLIPNLVEVLLRFRRWKYGLTADISKAFLQIRVRKEDQDVHRFLWDVRDQVRVMRFDRVVFGNASSPFLLNATIKFHLNKFCDSKVVTELKQNLYVDDWLTGADFQDEVAGMVTEAVTIMGKGGFPLAKWGSNSSVVNERIVKSLGTDFPETFPSLKILGMSWSTGEDCFHFDTLSVDHGLWFTKRLVLSFIARIYDPLGFLNPFVIGIKILFQEIWRLGLSWDDPLPSDMQKQMSEWVNGLQEIRRWKIPRCLTINGWTVTGDLSLLCYSDASEKGYGGSVYLKVTEGDVSRVSLVISRARVAPLKKITLPRLELLGALLVARLLVFVQRALELPAEVPYSCFTDSTIVLGWIKADPSKWKQFVGNRVIEIHSLTNPSNWNHCEGKSNPADLLTRGITAAELTESKFWIHGSTSTSLGSDLYARESELGEEMVEESGYDTILSVMEGIITPLLDYERFSHFPKLVRVIAWVKRFAFNLRTSHRRVSKTLEPLELKESEHFLLMSIQREAYTEEIQALKEKKQISKRSPVFKLCPCLGNDGLLRVQSRLQMSQVFSYGEKNPIILPKCHVSLLLVRFQHHLMKHAGVATLLSCLRDKYWIIGLRRLAKKVCHECVACQRQDSRACAQPMAPLPGDRINSNPPFSVVGVDHAGPVYCKDTGNKKHYILLFTCAVIRAVHLELVQSLSLEDFMLAFRKFCARRGVPNTIYSDNAMTFKGAQTLLQKLFGPNSPTWKFSAPLAPWWGGWWERLVRTTKSALRKSLGKESVNRSQFETILAEVEGCINSRPLTYVEEESAPLTPSHFLLGRSTPFMLSDASATQQPLCSSDLSLKNKELNRTLEHFWVVWNEQYIRNLPPLGNKKAKMNLEIGSVVLIREEGKPRLRWPLGKIISFHYGKDGLIRAATMKTENGEIVRAVQKLHMLEVSVSQSHPENLSKNDKLDESENGEDIETNVEADTGTGTHTGQRFSRKGRLLKPRQILDL